jgi:2C-methyl-D-erythritol 2,4-cyclodiphosphate synthase
MCERISEISSKESCVIKIFESKICRRILDPVYDNEKENGWILTNKEICVIVQKPNIKETIRLHRLRWFGRVLRIEENRIPKRVLYMNLESTKPRGRPRNKWQD